MPEGWYKGKFQGSCWMNCPEEQNVCGQVPYLGKAQFPCKVGT